MKSYLVLLLLTAGLSLNAQKSDQQPYMTQSLSGESIKKAEVETSGGSISVTGVNPSDARVEVYVRQNNNGELSKEEIKKRLEEDYDLTIAISNNKVTAKARPKNKLMNWKRSLSISFKLFVPQNTSTELATSGGSIRLEKLSGSHDFTTSGGSLHVSEVQGDIDGKTSGGSIHADHCSGKIELVTSGGSIEVDNLAGEIETVTSGGSIEGSHISGEFASHTSGGSIRLSDLSCTLKTSTSGGHISVSIKELGKYVRISNSGGNIELRLPANKGVDLDIDGRGVTTTTLSNFNGRMEKDKIKGTVNGGGVPVTVSAGGGRVDLSLN